MTDNLKLVEDSKELKTTTVQVTKASDYIELLKNEPEPREIWNGIIEGSKGLITGISKTGKTTLAENLAISIAVGRKDYLGFPLNGTPEKVLFVNFEESFRVRIRRNMKQIEILSEEELILFNDNFISTPKEFPEFLNSDWEWQELQDYIVASTSEIIIIDSLSHMVKGQIESSNVVTKFIKKFRKYICSLEKTVIIIHHNTKGNDKPLILENVAGSRMVAQEFEYIIGLSSIFGPRCGNYMCTLTNKYFAVHDNVELYTINETNWLENIGNANKYSLYDDDTKIDFRIDHTNRNLLNDFIQSQYSQHGQATLTGDLMKTFVQNESHTMSKDTLHKSLDKLVIDGKIEFVRKGIYQPKSALKNV